ncbi:MAG TPA: dihydroorotate dehydrogenase [Gemmatimonadaceae bacterium]|nr:dihydroorotate dehydrogenase [Gemmatimonadaceae bacterium]
MTTGSPLRTVVHNLSFQNPIVLAAGTAGYGEELAGVVRLEALGGLVTKAVSREPRTGAPSPRVAELEGGMINAVGLANPGLDAVRREHLPWLAGHLPDTRKIVNVVGFTVDEYPAVVAGLEEALSASGAAAVDAFELNVSCPNTKAGGLEFGADPASLAAVVATVRRETKRAVFVKLSPTLADIGAAAEVAADSGADAISVVNTIPGLAIDIEHRRPMLGFGTGGVSGPAILPVGVLATWRVRRAVSLPILGVGGVSSATDAMQYILAGASLVGVGTAALRDPRAPERIVRELEEWCRSHGVERVQALSGALEWPA